MSEIILIAALLGFAAAGWVVRHLGILGPGLNALVGEGESLALKKAEAESPVVSGVVALAEKAEPAAETTLVDLVQKHMSAVATAKDVFARTMAAHAALGSALKDVMGEK